MFQVGDYIVYGNTGVCEVENIGPLDIAGMPQDRVYYTLRPCYEKRTTIFTPIDNQKVVIRPVCTKEEALALIDEMPDIGFLEISDERHREAEYKACFLKCDSRELVKMLHTLYGRREERIAQGKKTTAKDDRYFHMTEDFLYGELSVALDMDRDQIKSFIYERVH